MMDACQLIMRIASKVLLPFTEEEFRRALRTKKEESEAADKSPLYDNSVLSVICDMVHEKYKANSDCKEVSIWEDTSGNLLKDKYSSSL